MRSKLYFQRAFRAAIIHQSNHLGWLLLLYVTRLREENWEVNEHVISFCGINGQQTVGAAACKQVGLAVDVCLYKDCLQTHWVHSDLVRAQNATFRIVRLVQGNNACKLKFDELSPELFHKSI